MVLPAVQQWLASGDRTAELDELLDGAIALAAAVRSDDARPLVVAGGAAYPVNSLEIDALDDLGGLFFRAASLAGVGVRLPVLLDGHDPLGQEHVGDVDPADVPAAEGDRGPAGVDADGDAGGVVDR
ncbi:MAG TPA: hypothetical protein VFP61_07645 [Acidimicrobiales bacterium]|nr:hypothetical protein [Acidimicrobiales bacterium]